MTEPDAPHSGPLPRLGRRLRARDAVITVAVTMLLLVLFEGAALRESGREMQRGWERTLVRAAGEPAGWIADRLPLGEVSRDATAWLSPDGEAGTEGSFVAAAGASDSDSGGSPAASTAPPPVGVDAFDPRELGERPAPPPPLQTLLVTGDSLSMPLDAVLARRFADAGGDVRVDRDPKVGTALSQTDLVDWGAASRQQVREREPEAVVVFIGANEGFPMEGPGGREAECCGRAWAAAYAQRVRQMMDTYRQRGGARVYWLLLPAPRDRARQEISRAVNAAIRVAAQPYRSQVRVVDLERVFTPAGRYRDAMEVDGRERIVRDSDGIHLSEEGAQVAADAVLGAIAADFGRAVPR
jgi:hypothetical protein